jgi:hypothetical protein
MTIYTSIRYVKFTLKQLQLTFEIRGTADVSKELNSYTVLDTEYRAPVATLPTLALNLLPFSNTTHKAWLLGVLLHWRTRL